MSSKFELMLSVGINQVIRNQNPSWHACWLIFNLNLLSVVKHENVLPGVTIDFHVISMMRMMHRQ